MRYFLIDFENTQSSGLIGVNLLTKRDKLIIFYSRQACKVDFREVQSLLKTEALIQFVEITQQGFNSLDFNLACYVGNISRGFRGTLLEIFIISKDAGFDSLIYCPLLKNVKVKRNLNISEALTMEKDESNSNQESTKSKKDEDFNTSLHEILRRFSADNQFGNVKNYK